MKKEYIAHINEYTDAIQTVQQHSFQTAVLCREYAIPAFKDFLYVVGLLHDIGKYMDEFQKRIRGEQIRVEHSTCGTLAAGELFPNVMGLMMQFCIAGHHSGLPDAGFPNDTAELGTLYGRLKREFSDYSEYKRELEIPSVDFGAWAEFVAGDCRKDQELQIDKFAFLTRYAFSCLVDADSTDTADFCREEERPRALRSDFQACLDRVNARLSAFVCRTNLQKARSALQEQAFRNADRDAEIYLLNMPTGSGKTLASVKIALERALAGKKKRIIYVIPYNSIIDQTVDVFEGLFGGELEILRHQSTFSYEDAEDQDEDYRKAATLAAENWDAPFIVTTAVQFFESVYANKRGKLRKLHNMADSILVFDEAHLMPQNYLQPCLQSIAFITRYLDSEAIFLTATMPDFENLIHKYALPDSKIFNLIQDTSLFGEFQKCRYKYIGEVEVDVLLEKSSQSPSSLVIVNSKKAARQLFRECSTGKKYHLSTYMTPYDRKRILQEIREELNRLEKDYPTYEAVPKERRITIIATSLIEAGVDLDVYTVFRERSGLDSVLQAGGRCNREGRRAIADVFVFDFADHTRRTAIEEKGNLAKGILGKYADISEPSCIVEYYNKLYFMKQEEIQKNAMHEICTNIKRLPFKEYAEKFELIDSKTVSVVVVRDEKSRELAEHLRYTKSVNTRMLQNYVCTIYQKELEDLIKQHVVEDYGTGVYCLTNLDYYDEQIGILFEARDYFL